MEKHETAIIPRRAFLASTAAAIASVGFFECLPRVQGGYLVPKIPLVGPDIAYAAQTATSDDAWFKFQVVGVDQVGIHVVDVSRTDESKNFVPVPRAKVKLISRADETKFVEGETDDEGKVIFDIGSIAMRDEDGNLTNDWYQVNARVELDGSNCRPKMRDFCSRLSHLIGANGYIIATHMLEDDDDQYVEQLGFDDWDILYSKQQFTRSAENDIKHWITASVKGVPSEPTNCTIVANYYDAEAKRSRSQSFSPSESKYDKEKKRYTVSFGGHFLESGDDDCLNGDTIDLTFQYSLKDESKPHKLTTTFDTWRAPLEGAKYTSPLVPFLSNNRSLGSISSSNDWPCFNGVNVTIVNFDFPVHLIWSPGCLVLSFGQDFAIRDDKGLHSPNEWKDQATKPIKERFKRTVDDQKDALKTWGQRRPYKDKNNQQVGHVWAKKISLNLIVNAILGIQFDEFSGEGEGVKKLFSGFAGAGFGADLRGSLSFKFTVGPVPFYVTITVGLELMFGGMFTITKECLKDDPVDIASIEWVPNGTLALTIKPSFKLSVGVGVEGVLCLSVSGGITIPMFIGWFEAKPSDDADDTHFTVGYSFKLEIYLQLIAFTMTVSVWSAEKNPFYDNWKDKTPPTPETAAVGEPVMWGDDSGARFLRTQKDGLRRHDCMMTDNGELLAAAGNDLLSSLVPVTMADMGHSYEAAAVKLSTGAVGSVSDEEKDLPTVVRNKIPKVKQLADGSLVTEFVDCEGVNSFTFGDELASTVLGLEAQSDNSDASATAPNAVVVGSVSQDGNNTLIAGASPLLTTQANLFLGDPFLGFGETSTGEYTYNPVAGKTTGAVCDLGGIHSIGEFDGIRPSVDVVIYDQVFSDPRQRIVNFSGSPYMFRIMTVDYSVTGETIRRPRVVASKFDLTTKTWGEPKVIEYGSGSNALKRIDIFDYDFDIAVRSEGSEWTRHVEACLVIAGGTRPQGDNTSIYNAFATPTVTVLLLDENLNVFQRVVKQASELYNDNLSHMVCAPRIRDGFAVAGASGSLVFSFLHRKAAQPEQLMSDAATVSFGFGFCYVRDGALSLMMNTQPSGGSTDPVVVVDPLELDSSVTSMDMVIGEGDGKNYDALVTFLFYKTQGYDVCSAAIPVGKSFADAVVRHNIASSAELPQIAAWPGHGTFLFTKHRDPDEAAQSSDYYLYAGKFNPLTEKQPGFETNYERVDYNGFKGNSFCVSPTGKYLFYYETFKGNIGDDVEPDKDDPTKAVHKPVNVQLYRIMASKFINGKFSEDFPFCELANPIDGFEVMNITEDASTFLASEVTDVDHSLGRLRYIAVPNTLSAEIEGFSVFDAFACAGKTCQFQIDVRNHGNLIIGGFDVSMYDPDKGVRLVDTFSVQAIDQERILTTANSRRPWMDDVQVPEEDAVWVSSVSDADDLSVAADDGLAVGEILPGEILSYLVEFTIPEDWRDEKEVIMRLTNIWSPGIQMSLNDSLNVAAGEPVSTVVGSSEGPIALYLHPGVGGSFTTRSPEASSDLIDPIEEDGGNEEDNPTPTPDDNPNTKPSPSSTSGAAAKTGDSVPGLLAVMGVAVGAAGALLGAYSMRRTAIEQGDDTIEIDDFEVEDV